MIGIIFIGVVIYHLLPTKIPVLTYHNFTKEKKNESLVITEEEFEKQIKFLKDHHYHSLTLEQIDCFMNHTCKIPKKSVMITIDDGWKSTLEIAAPILKKYQMNAVLFYIGHNISGENPSFLNSEEMEVLKREYPNIEIASHTYDLHQEDAYLQEKDVLLSDMEKMKTVIRNPYFAYPYGRHSENYHEALKEAGYRLAFTFGPGEEHRKLSSKDSIYELPRLNMSSSMPFWKFVLRLIWFY